MDSLSRLQTSIREVTEIQIKNKYLKLYFDIIGCSYRKKANYLPNWHNKQIKSMRSRYIDLLKLNVITTCNGGICSK